MQQQMTEILDRYLKERVPLLGKRTQIDYTRHVAKLREHFGTKIAQELTLDDINAFMTLKGGKHQRNRQRAVLSSALEAAMEWKWLDYNIVKSVKRYPSQPRTRVVSDKELAAFKQKFKGRRKIMLAVDLTRLTGLKQGAVLRLRWDQVHESERRILARHHITNEKIEVPITNELQAVLNRCKELCGKKKSSWVIPTQSGVPYTSQGFRANWQRVMRAWQRTGNDTFTFNDITKTGARERKRISLQDAEADDPTVARFLEFDPVVRAEATKMSAHYKVFYCLEKSIRALVATAMEEAYGTEWWNRVDPGIQNAVEDNKSREIDSGMDPRSDQPIDYTTFGQLNVIISQNWDAAFIKKLRRKDTVGNVMTKLNRIRGPIAHFSVLKDLDVKRLEFTVAEWFDQLIT